MKAPLPVSSSPSLPLFVYGTLMAPAVVETLIQRPIRGRPADLISSLERRRSDRQDYDFSRHPVIGQAYPGLVNWTTQPSLGEKQLPSVSGPVGRKRIRGLLYCDLTDSEMKQLDYFEGDQYGKEVCNIQLVANSSVDANSIRSDDGHSSDDMIQAMVYVWTNPLSELDVTQDWSFDFFVENHLSEYVGMNVQPCRDEFLAS